MQWSLHAKRCWLGCLKKMANDFSDDARAEDVLCLPFYLSGFCQLSARELAQLEASCRCLRQLLNSKATSMAWAVAVNAMMRLSRLVLPIEVLAEMPRLQLKHILKSVKQAQGPVNGRPVNLKSIELCAVTAACERSAKRVVPVSERSDPVRVVVGRIHFDHRDLVNVARFGETDDGEDLLCFSNDVAFWWPSSGHGGTMLVASLGLGKEINILEVASVLKPFGETEIVLSLNVDVHLAYPGFETKLIMDDLEVDVDCDSIPSVAPALDVSNEDTRAALACQEGVLCILVVRGPEQKPSPIHKPLTRYEIVKCSTSEATMTSTATRLNALALSPVCRPIAF